MCKGSATNTSCFLLTVTHSIPTFPFGARSLSLSASLRSYIPSLRAWRKRYICEPMTITAPTTRQAHNVACGDGTRWGAYDRRMGRIRVLQECTGMSCISKSIFPSVVALLVPGGGAGHCVPFNGSIKACAHASPAGVPVFNYRLQASAATAATYCYCSARLVFVAD